jgi:hypothetical protein
MTVYPIQTIIGVNKSTFIVDLGESVDIKINYTVEGSEFLILGANCSVDWPSLYNRTSDTQGFVVRFDTVNLSIDTYTAIIKLEKPGFETAYKSITVIINRIDIKVNTIDFQDSIKAFLGDTIRIRINLTESRSEIFIENASISYSWAFGVGNFDYVANGTYQLEMKLPGTVEGDYKMKLTILKEDSIYKSREFSFLISIRAREQPNYLIWVIISGLLIGISILGIISLRSYVFIPLKRKKESDLLAKTQKYKDIMNIETILISNRHSGIHLYSKSYSLLKNYQNELLTGFIQAITLISNEIVGKEKLEKISIKADNYKGIEKIIELDFKHFNFFICDYKDLRIIFILKDKASERLKNKSAEFLSSMDLLVSDKLKKWDGSLDAFNDVLPSLLEKHFHLNYKEKFKINPVINTPLITKEGEFNKVGKRLLNVIVSMTSVQEEFYLEDALTTVHGKNKDKLIEALEKLIEGHIIISSIVGSIK